VAGLSPGLSEFLGGGLPARPGGGGTSQPACQGGGGSQPSLPVKAARQQEKSFNP